MDNWKDRFLHNFYHQLKATDFLTLLLTLVAASSTTASPSSFPLDFFSVTATGSKDSIITGGGYRFRFDPPTIRSGRKTCLIPSFNKIGAIIPDAPARSRIPIHIDDNVGNGAMSRLIPNRATAKKWPTKCSGVGFSPDSSATGPDEHHPPLLR